MQWNKVCFLTDAADKRKYTPGQEVVTSHVKPCFCLGTEAEGQIHQEKKKETFVIHQLLIRVQTWMDDVRTKTNQRTEQRLLLPSCQRVCVCVRLQDPSDRNWSQLHQQQTLTGLKQSAEYRLQHFDL